MAYNSRQSKISLDALHSNIDRNEEIVELSISKKDVWTQINYDKEDGFEFANMHGNLKLPPSKPDPSLSSQRYENKY